MAWMLAGALNTALVMETSGVGKGVGMVRVKVCIKNWE